MPVQGSDSTEFIESNGSRRAFAQSNGVTDLGRLPDRIRAIAGFWGGSAPGARAIHELVRSNGFTRSIDELRSEITRIHDHGIRKEFLLWLASRAL